MGRQFPPILGVALACAAGFLFLRQRGAGVRNVTAALGPAPVPVMVAEPNLVLSLLEEIKSLCEAILRRPVPVVQLHSDGDEAATDALATAGADDTPAAVDAEETAAVDTEETADEPAAAMVQTVAERPAGRRAVYRQCGVQPTHATPPALCTTGPGAATAALVAASAPKEPPDEPQGPPRLRVSVMSEVPTAPKVAAGSEMPHEPALPDTPPHKPARVVFTFAHRGAGAVFGPIRLGYGG